MNLPMLTVIFCVVVVLVVVFARWYIQFVYKMLYVRPKQQIEEALFRDDIPAKWEKYGKAKQKRKLKKLIKFVKQDRLMTDSQREEQLDSLHEILESISEK